MENGFIYKLSMKKLKYRKSLFLAFLMAGLMVIGLGFWNLLTFDSEKFPDNYKYVGLIMFGYLGLFFCLISLIYLWRYKKGIANFDNYPYLRMPEQYRSDIKKFLADVDKEEAGGEIIYEKKRYGGGERLLILPSYLIFIHMNVNIIPIKDILWVSLNNSSTRAKIQGVGMNVKTYTIEIFYEKGIFEEIIKNKKTGIEILEVINKNFGILATNSDDKLRKLYFNDYEEFKRRCHAERNL